MSLNLVSLNRGSTVLTILFSRTQSVPHLYNMNTGGKKWTFPPTLIVFLWDLDTSTIPGAVLMINLGDKINVGTILVTVRMNSRYECQINFFRSIKCPTRFLKFAQLVSNYLSFDAKVRQFDTSWANFRNLVGHLIDRKKSIWHSYREFIQDKFSSQWC